MFKFFKKNDFEKKGTVSRITAGRLCIAYGIFAGIMAAPVAWLIWRDITDVILLAVVALCLFGYGAYLLFIRKKPIKFPIFPDSFSSRQLMRRGPKVIPIFVMASIASNVAILLFISLAFGEKEVWADIAGLLGVFVVLDAIRQTHEMLMSYIALCDYYNNGGAENV